MAFCHGKESLSLQGSCLQTTDSKSYTVNLFFPKAMVAAAVMFHFGLRYPQTLEEHWPGCDILGFTDILAGFRFRQSLSSSTKQFNCTQHFNRKGAGFRDRSIVHKKKKKKDLLDDDELYWLTFQVGFDFYKLTPQALAWQV